MCVDRPEKIFQQIYTHAARFWKVL